MGRTPTTGTATDEPRTPEIITSAALADIVTLELVDMISAADVRYEAAHLRRRMTPVLNAVRGLVRDVRALHGLPVIDWRSGLVVGETASDNGAAPAASQRAAEAAEATS